MTYRYDKRPASKLRRDCIQLAIIWGAVLISILVTWYLYEKWTEPIFNGGNYEQR